METYLAHHGILGMKWGIRRYQNKDGSLTTAGKRRYADTEDMYRSESKKSAAKAGANVAKAAVVGGATIGLRRHIGEKAANALEKAAEYRAKGNLHTDDAIGNFANADFVRKLGLKGSYGSSNDELVGKFFDNGVDKITKSAEAFQKAGQYAAIARGAATAASIISGVGTVAVIGSGIISAGQLAYSAYLKNQAKKAAAASGNSKES